MSLFEYKRICETRPQYLPKECYPDNFPVWSPVTKKQKSRVVAPFSLEAHRQRGTVVEPFQGKSLIKPYPVGNTLFRKLYLRGDFPIAMEFDATGPKVAWKESLNKLDYSFYLPMFFNGLCEVDYPYEFFAKEGIREMLEQGKKRVLPVIPQLILPIKSDDCGNARRLWMRDPVKRVFNAMLFQTGFPRHLVCVSASVSVSVSVYVPYTVTKNSEKNALNTRNRQVVVTTLKILQKLVTCDDAIGEALVPFYRQILSPFNLYQTYNVNLGDEIDYGQRKKENIGDLVDETLRLLEIFGGKNAFINIKYMIPTYKSCVLS